MYRMYRMCQFWSILEINWKPYLERRFSLMADFGDEIERENKDLKVGAARNLFLEGLQGGHEWEIGIPAPEILYSASSFLFWRFRGSPPWLPRGIWGFGDLGRGDENG